MFFSETCNLGIKVAYGDFEPFDGYCRADAFFEYADSVSDDYTKVKK